MNQNKNLIEENTKLNSKVNLLESELEHYNNNFEDPDNNNKSIIDLNQRVNDLENVIHKLRVNNNHSHSNSFMQNDENELKNVLMNTVNELKEKDKIIESLKFQLKETISKKTINFDDKVIVSSMSQKLREKDSEINNLRKKIDNELDNKINKYEEILKNKNEFFSQIKND